MKKILVTVIVVFVLLTAVVVVGKNIIAKTILTKGLKAVCGLEFKVDSIDIGILSTSVEIKGLKVYNPAGFSDKLLADVPEIYLDYDLGSLFSNKLHLKELRVNVKELLIVQDNRTKVNLNSLAVLAPLPSNKKPPEVQIDKLNLRIRKMVYKNYVLSKNPQIIEINADINEDLTDVNNPRKFSGSEVMKLLSHFGIANPAEQINKKRRQG